MDINELARDPFFAKFLQKTARMLGEWYQQKAATMTNDELYEDSDFFPAYNPERDYSQKPDGYICRAEDGTMLRLVRNTDSVSAGAVSGSLKGSAGTTAVNKGVVFDAVTSEFVWQACWSTKPDQAKKFVEDPNSPYNKNEVCSYDGEVYRCLITGTSQSPAEAPGSWEKVEV